jgi:hypothetical protein
MEDNRTRKETTASQAVERSVENAQGQEDQRDRRAARIEEYLRDSLDNENPLLANLGAGAADLMHIRTKLVESLKTELDMSQVTLEEYRKEFAPVVSSLLVLDRYIVAYARLGHDLSRARPLAGRTHREDGDKNHGPQA